MGRSLPKPIEVLIRNDLAELAIVRSRLERVGSQIGLDEKIMTPLLVGVDELVSNVIKYGWPDTQCGPAHEITVRVLPGVEAIEVEILDDGQPFDPTFVLAPKPVPPGRRRQPGGVGLHMMSKLVDDIRYERLGGRNRTVITKRYGPAATRGIG